MSCSIMPAAYSSTCCRRSRRPSGGLLPRHGCGSASACRSTRRTRACLLLPSLDEVDRRREGLVIDGFHTLAGQRAGIFDFCVPSSHRSDDRITPRGPKVSRTCGRHPYQVGRVVLVFRLFLGVQVIEVAEELIKPVVRGQMLVKVTKVVLAELSCRVALLFEQRGDGDVLLCMPCGAPGRPTLDNPVRNAVCPVMKVDRPAVQDCSA